MARGAGGLLWRKAPRVLRHFPGVLAGVVAATAILALASASAPLFFSSASNLAVARRIQEVTPWQAGLMLRVRAPAGTAGELFEQRADAVRDAVAGLDHLGRPVTTVLASATLRPAGRADESADVQVVTRSGARDHVDVLARLSDGRVRVIPERVAAPLRACERREPPTAAGEAGILISDFLATELDLCPGDRVVVGQGRGFPLVVSAVYRDLRVAQVDRFWELLASEYEFEIGPTFAVVGPRTLTELAPQLRGQGLYRWEVPVELEGLTLEEAETLAGRLRDLVAEVDSLSSPFPDELFPRVNADSFLLNIGEQSELMVSRSRAPVGFLSLGGTLVALGVTAAAGAYGVHRRRVEFNLLSTRGVPPLVLGARTSLEALLPAAAGCLIGWGAAIAIVSLLGPGPLLGTEAFVPALARAAAVVGLGVLLLGAVTAAGVGFVPTPSLARARGVMRALPWELALLGLAYLSWERLTVSAEQASRVTSRTLEVDLLVFVFPMLFVAGGAGLLCRLLRWVLPRMRVAGGRLRAPVFLALRRVAAAPSIVLTLVLLAAVAIGTFLYAGTLASSGRATVRAKALTFVGSDVSVPLPPSPQVPPGVHAPATIVTEVSYLRLTPGPLPVDVLGVDPVTFADAAFWDRSFADRDLEELMRLIAWRGGEGRVPAIVTGVRSLRRDVLLESAGDSIPLRVLDIARSWPGIFSTRPMVVVDRRALDPSPGSGALTGAGVRYEMWAKGSPKRILDEVEGAGLSLKGAVTAPGARDAPVLLPLEWSFGFLQGLGATSGLLALVGMLLYLQARQAARVVAGALAARMGLKRRDHAVSIAVELAMMLAVAFFVGTVLSAVAAGLIYDRIDPLPIVPPPPLLRVPLALAGGIGALLGVAVAVGAWRVQRSADRANVAEVLRVAG